MLVAELADASGLVIGPMASLVETVDSIDMLALLLLAEDLAGEPFEPQLWSTIRTISELADWIIQIQQRSGPSA